MRSPKSIYGSGVSLSSSSSDCTERSLTFDNPHGSIASLFSDYPERTAWKHATTTPVVPAHLDEATMNDTNTIPSNTPDPQKPPQHFNVPLNSIPPSLFHPFQLPVEPGTLVSYMHGPLLFYEVPTAAFCNAQIRLTGSWHEEGDYVGMFLYIGEVFMLNAGMSFIQGSTTGDLGLQGDFAGSRDDFFVNTDTVILRFERNRTARGKLGNSLMVFTVDEDTGHKNPVKKIDHVFGSTGRNVASSRVGFTAGRPSSRGGDLVASFDSFQLELE
jgi:hypothetical protein